MASALETGALVPVSQKAAQDYAAHADNLLNYVDGCMKQAPLDALAAKQVEMMLQNHRNHLQFMMSFFRLNNPELLKEIVIWVYRAYQAHGFSPDYFPAVLRRWMEAVSQFLPPESATEILGVYGWMLENHQRFLAAADEYRHMEQEAAGAPHPLQALRNEFLQGLIAGSLSRCNACATGYITGKDELREFYLGVVQPAMIEIGNLWERGELSVAREHLATAIVTRIMAAQHMRFFGLEKPKGKALISAAANEFHELGARMVADLFDLDGWDVTYIGSNVPVEAAEEMIRNEKPSVVGLSVTMPFNLEKTADLVDRIHSSPELAGVKIIVGGRAFQFSPTLWQTIGADAYANNAIEALNAANSFMETRPREAE